MCPAPELRSYTILHWMLLALTCRNCILAFVLLLFFFALFLLLLALRVALFQALARCLIPMLPLLVAIFCHVARRCANGVRRVFLELVAPTSNLQSLELPDPAARPRSAISLPDGLRPYLRTDVNQTWNYRRRKERLDRTVILYCQPLL